MNRFVRAVRRLDPRRSQVFSVISPTVQITWEDIMHDLDAGWNTIVWTRDSSESEIR